MSHLGRIEHVRLVGQILTLQVAVAIAVLAILGDAGAMIVPAFLTAGAIDLKLGRPEADHGPW